MADYDLVVIGAGPAGSMAARITARYGLSVLVLEQKKVVGYPSHCAGGILTPILDHIGLAATVKNSIRAQIRKIKLISPLGRSVTHQFNRKIGYVVDRPAFDQLLIRDAQQKGAELLTQTRAIGLKRDNDAYNQVIIKHKNEIQKIQTRIIIGADGVASNVAKWVGLSIPRIYSGIGFGYNAENILNISPDTVEIYFLSAIPGGYAWIFPKGTESANIGVGGYNTGTYMHKVFEWFRLKHPIVSTKLRQVRLMEYTGGIVPGSKMPRKTTFNWGICCGNAANQVDSLTGEGIRLALICGDLGGKIAISAIQQNNLSLIHNYHKLMQRKIGLELAVSYFLRHFLLRSNAEDYDSFVQAISKMNLNLVFNKRTWIPLFFQGISRTPSVLKIIKSAFRSLPPIIKSSS